MRISEEWPARGARQSRAIGSSNLPVPTIKFQSANLSLRDNAAHCRPTKHPNLEIRLADFREWPARGARRQPSHGSSNLPVPTIEFQSANSAFVTTQPTAAQEVPQYVICRMTPILEREIREGKAEPALYLVGLCLWSFTLRAVLARDARRLRGPCTRISPRSTPWVGRWSPQGCRRARVFHSILRRWRAEFLRSRRR